MSVEKTKMTNAYQALEAAKREHGKLEADFESAKAKVANAVEHEARAQKALDEAGQVSSRARLFKGSDSTPDRVAEAERVLGLARDATAAARRDASEADRQRLQAQGAVDAALQRARAARVAYSNSEIETVRRSLRSDIALQARLAELDRARLLAVDAKIGLNLSSLTETWLDVLAETFPQPTELPQAA